MEGASMLLLCPWNLCTDLYSAKGSKGLRMKVEANILICDKQKLKEMSDF